MKRQPDQPPPQKPVPDDQVAGDEEAFWTHALTPSLVGVLSDPDGFARPTRGGCADSIELYLRVEGEVIRDLRFLPLGCVHTTACASSLADQILGKSFSEALAITPEMVMEPLGGLPPHFHHCAELAVFTLKEAVEDCLARRKKPWESA